MSEVFAAVSQVKRRLLLGRTHLFRLSGRDLVDFVSEERLSQALGKAWAGLVGGGDG